MPPPSSFHLPHKQGVESPKDGQARRGSPSAMPLWPSPKFWLRHRAEIDPFFMKVLEITELQSSKDRDHHIRSPPTLVHMWRWNPGVLTPIWALSVAVDLHPHLILKEQRRTQDGLGLSLLPTPLLLLDGPQRKFMGRVKVCTV